MSNKTFSVGKLRTRPQEISPYLGAEDFSSSHPCRQSLGSNGSEGSEGGDLRAWQNPDFMRSKEARQIRILCEFTETSNRLRRENVLGTVLFLGSARIPSPEQWTESLSRAESLGDAEKVKTLHKQKALTKYWHVIEKLSALITEWALTQEADQAVKKCLAKMPPSHHSKFDDNSDIRFPQRSSPDDTQTFVSVDTDRTSQRDEHESDTFRGSQIGRTIQAPKFEASPLAQDETAFRDTIATPCRPETSLKPPLRQSSRDSDSKEVDSQRRPYLLTNRLVVCTGGGPGLMEAANRGAASVPGGRTMGMGITLPYESELNCYVTPSLRFIYHYFFTRKFWMVYVCMGVVACPGGFGTLDEIFELLTLRNTGRFRTRIPIVFIGKDYWQNTVNFQYLRDCGVISEDDYNQLFWTDSPEEAFEHIRYSLINAVAYPGPKRSEQ